MQVVNDSFIFHVLITDKLIRVCQFSRVQWTGRIRPGFAKHFAQVVARSGAHRHGEYTLILLPVSLPLALVERRGRVQSKLWCINCSFLVFDPFPVQLSTAFTSMISRRVSRYLSITSVFLFLTDNRSRTFSTSFSFLHLQSILLFFSIISMS